MPRYNYVPGDVYRVYKEQIMWCFPREQATVAPSYHDLRAQDPPGGEFGPLAFVMAFGNAASGSVAGELWAWNGSSTAADDDSTVLVPDSAPAAGRWLYVTGG